MSDDYWIGIDYATDPPEVEPKGNDYAEVAQKLKEMALQYSKVDWSSYLPSWEHIASAQPKQKSITGWTFAMYIGPSAFAAQVSTGTSVEDVLWLLSTIGYGETTGGTPCLHAGAKNTPWAAPYQLRVVLKWSNGTKTMFQFRTRDPLEMERYAMGLFDRVHSEAGC